MMIRYGVWERTMMIRYGVWERTTMFRYGVWERTTMIRFLREGRGGSAEGGGGTRSLRLALLLSG